MLNGLTGDKSPLELCVSDSRYVELIFNSQGFPIAKSPKQESIPGFNIFFRPPIVGRMTRFKCYSGRATFECDATRGHYDINITSFECYKKTKN